ncbi:MAG: cobaltochelatase subunit CobN, partial [Planctomycetaceae bacterium]|nr:cobaltochelatase subunit CobN [Planctomycetaceae bacterium]
MVVGKQALQMIKAFHYGRMLVWMGLVVLSSLQALSATIAAQQAVDEPTAEIGFIGLHGGIYEQLLPLAKNLPVQLTYFEDERIESGKADLGSVRVLYIQHTRAEDRELYKKRFVEAKKKNPKLVVIAFQSSTAELFSSLGIGDVLTDDKTAGQYYGSSTENLRRLLVYTGKTYLGRDWKVEPPEDAIVEGFYHPDHSGKFFSTAEELLLWLRKEKKILPTQPRLLVAVHGIHLVFQQPKVVDALIREAERQGAVAAAVVDGRSSSYKTETKLFQPSAIIHTCHSMDQLDFRLDLDVPHLHSIFIRKQSIDQWQQSVDGLSS